MRPRQGPKIIIPHFKGVNDVVPDDDPFHVQKTGGVIDEVGGHLCRLTGKLPATSGPFPSVISMEQLRFQHSWGMMVHASTNRYVYTPGEVTDDDLDPPPPPIPNIDPTPGPEPGIECKSYFGWVYGLWKTPITDATLHFTQKGSLNQWCGNETGPNCHQAVVNASANVLVYSPEQGWHQWDALLPPPWNPNYASRIWLNSYTTGGNPGANWGYSEFRWTAKSATLAGTDPLAFDGAVIQCGTMFLVIPGGLGTSIGSSWWGQNPDYTNNRSPRMIFYDANRVQLVAHAIAENEFTCPTSPPPIITRYFSVNTGSPAVPDEAYFYNEEWRFITHDSCYES